VAAMPQFSALAVMAQKVIVDSDAASDSVAALEALAARAGREPWVADLAWTRLTRLRQMISQMFENRTHLAELPNVKDIEVAYDGALRPAAAWYIAAWLLDALQQVGVTPQLRMQAGGGNAIRLLPGYSVDLIEGETAEIRTGNVVTCTAFPAADDYSLMREELSVPGRDPMFEKTLAAAAQLALKSRDK
jgi:glucose-6-phosphate dehydrogenase assembly protein OpcA